MNVAAVYGAVKNGTPWSLFGTVSYLSEFNEFLPQIKPHYSTILLGGNVGYKREVFNEHDICFTDIFPSEDTIFAWTLKQKGEKIYFDPSVLVYHINRTKFKELIRHQNTLGKASAEARRTTRLSGQIFVKYPLLSLALPIVRWCRAALRIIKVSLPQFLLFVLLTPIYLIASVAWSFGFLSKGRFSEAKIKIRER